MKTETDVENSDTWPVDRFIREVCRAVKSYTPDVQHMASVGFYNGEKLRDVIASVKVRLIARHN